MYSWWTILAGDHLTDITEDIYSSKQVALFKIMLLNMWAVALLVILIRNYTFFTASKYAKL